MESSLDPFERLADHTNMYIFMFIYDSIIYSRYTYRYPQEVFVGRHLVHLSRRAFTPPERM